jgi:hypothetical protein
MTKQMNASMAIGMLLAITFIGISLYILFIPLPVAFAGKNDLQLYAMLTGSYGVWRAFRVFLNWKDLQEDN